MATGIIKNRLSNMITSTSLLNNWTGSIEYIIDGKLMIVSGSITSPSSDVSFDIFQLPNNLHPKRFSVQRARDVATGEYLDMAAHLNGKIVIYEPIASHVYQFNFCFMLA